MCVQRTHTHTPTKELLGKALFDLSRSRAHTRVLKINITHSLLLLLHNVSAQKHAVTALHQGGGRRTIITPKNSKLEYPPSLSLLHPPSPSRLSAISQRTLFVSKLPHTIPSSSSSTSSLTRTVFSFHSPHACGHRFAGTHDPSPPRGENLPQAEMAQKNLLKTPANRGRK